MKTNIAPTKVYTHEGGLASHIKPIDELRRTVLACLLWEESFYEAGESVADRIKHLVPMCSPTDVAEVAIEAREQQHLRHAPLLLVRELARDPRRCEPGLISRTLARVIQRADELTEFLSLYWNGGKVPISKQVKKGLSAAFCKFSEYALAKYNRDGSIKLRDVLFLVHAKPKDEKQAALWKRLAEGTLATPDTWEVALSSGADKGATFERLLIEGKLGYLALLRNLRNMQEAKVNKSLIFSALLEGAEKSKALPFRYVAAARSVPAWEREIDQAMQISMSGLAKLTGSTIVLVDVSGSMEKELSSRSDLTRLDAAAALAVLARGVCEDVRVFTFSMQVVEVPPRAGMALIDVVKLSQSHAGTYLGAAVEAIRNYPVEADRMIVLTDEQSNDKVGKPIGRGYMINVSTNEYGVGYGDWTHINGFSESVLSYIVAAESYILPTESLS